MGELFREEDFELNGIKYNIRVETTENGYEVSPYKEGLKLPLTYIVSYETNMDFNHNNYSILAIDKLIELVKLAIQQGYIK